MTARSITDRLGGLAFGGDYNPEQWDEPVWKEDDELMRQARINRARQAARAANPVIPGLRPTSPSPTATCSWTNRSAGTG
ncbi:beta-galactosidase BgaB [Streptomyces jeddahensis]|uniref:Beta-galactosidase BgaB n=1 Tax=Streptomyces jeddahensis TaxID=1716141 RepID=A0A177HGQ0_9ACTN|nr:beta-galactosidase BgaB [Streptomyces jeddahensis]